MKNIILAALVSGLLALAGLSLFFWYLNPSAPEPETDRVSAEITDEVPVGYFDLRGNREVLISLQEFDINPEKIIIDRGTKIIWKNSDRVFHRVVSDTLVGDKPLFDSQNIKSGNSFEITLAEAGGFPYRCAAHPDTMKGVIIVDE